MEYLNRFKSTVTSVAASVSSSLPGNPVTREYEAGVQVASAGPALSWKVFSGQKRSTKQAVSVWLLEKKAVDRWPKRDRELLVETLKKGVSQLTRLRHPRLLIVEHPLEESRDSYAFCTEPVFASLANVLGRIDNMPELVPEHIADFQLLELEIKHGLGQLAEGLSFLHNDAKILHRNVSPESVLINEKGAWKLAGFDLCLQAKGDNQYDLVEWDPILPASLQPSLDYLAPEYVLAGRCDCSADIYSLGVLCFALFTKGRTPMDHADSLDKLKKNVQKLKAIPPKVLQVIPQGLREDVKMCLNYTPELRPDATQFSKIGYFDDPLIKTLNYFDSLCQMDNTQKAQFFKGLCTIISNFPKRVLLQKVLPFLTAEFQTADLIPFILPSVFHIAEEATETEFTNIVLPPLVPVFAIQRPYQICLMLLQKMELFLAKTPEEELKNHVLPLLYNSLDSETPKVQELSLGIIPNIARLVNKDTMKSMFLPKLLKLACDGCVLSVKVNSLVCLGKMMNHLETWMITDQVLPTLPKVTSKEPGVLMAILGIYKLAFASQRVSMSKESCAKSALPFLVSASVENTLNLKQFEQFCSLIRAMLDKVENEQRSRLQQLSAMQEEQRSVTDFGDVLKQNETNKAARAISPDLSDLSVANSAQNGIETSPKKKSGPLSLAQKKRLAAEQELNIRLRSQGSIAPTQKTPSASRGPAPLLTPTPGPSLLSQQLGVPLSRTNNPVDLTNILTSSNSAVRGPNCAASPPNFAGTSAAQAPQHFPPFAQSPMEEEQKLFGSFVTATAKKDTSSLDALDVFGGQNKPLTTNMSIAPSGHKLPMNAMGANKSVLNSTGGSSSFGNVDNFFR